MFKMAPNRVTEHKPARAAHEGFVGKRIKITKPGYLEPIGRQNLIANRLIGLTRFLSKKYGIQKASSIVNFEGHDIRASELAAKYSIEEVFISMKPAIPKKREMGALRKFLLRHLEPHEIPSRKELPTALVKRMRWQILKFGGAREAITLQKRAREDLLDMRANDSVLNSLDVLEARCTKILMAREPPRTLTELVEKFGRKYSVATSRDIIRNPAVKSAPSDMAKRFVAMRILKSMENTLDKNQFELLKNMLVNNKYDDGAKLPDEVIKTALEKLKPFETEAEEIYKSSGYKNEIAKNAVSTLHYACELAPVMKQRAAEKRG